MTAILAPLKALIALNSFLLRLGRFLAWTALALMVVVILIQIVFRYLPMLDALNWPEEAARFLMLWMTGLIAPSAFRWGGFVAIDMLPSALPRVPSLILSLVLLGLALMVLLVAVQIGFDKHLKPGCLFNSSTLWVPLSIDLGPLSPCKNDGFAFKGFEWTRVKLAWMYMSLWVGLCLMVAVNIELILRALIKLISPAQALPDDHAMIAAGAD